MRALLCAHSALVVTDFSGFLKFLLLLDIVVNGTEK